MMVRMITFVLFCSAIKGSPSVFQFGADALGRDQGARVCDYRADTGTKQVRLGIFLNLCNIPSLTLLTLIAIGGEPKGKTCNCDPMLPACVNATVAP